jgi:hypothetical protein
VRYGCGNRAVGRVVALGRDERGSVRARLIAFRQGALPVTGAYEARLPPSPTQARALTTALKGSALARILVASARDRRWLWVGQRCDRAAVGGLPAGDLGHCGPRAARHHESRCSQGQMTPRWIHESLSAMASAIRLATSTCLASRSASDPETARSARRCRLPSVSVMFNLLSAHRNSGSRWQVARKWPAIAGQQRRRRREDRPVGRSAAGAGHLPVQGHQFMA